MKRLGRLIVMTTLLMTLAIPARMAAAAPAPRYTLIDMGTLGGPNAYFNLPGQTMNRAGAAVFSAETSTPDPLAPYCTDPECLGQLGIEYRRGVKTTLQSLPGASFAAPFSVNDTGLAVGISELSTIDPEINFPAARAVLWRNGHAVNLGTLRGGSESNAFAVNDQGLIAGPSNNAKPDPYGCEIFICWPTQTRGFVWQNGVMKDMGTLGGPDALPVFMNNAGQIAGWSYINDTPNADNGPGCVPGPAPTLEPFLWQNGHMRPLGTLGGTCGYPNWMNSSGEVVGQSNLAGNQTWHPFLWNGRTMLDLFTLGGSLGGSFGSANWINDAGRVVGWATTSGDTTAHGFLWEDGRMIDLGTAPGRSCSVADAVNARDQVVGGSCDPHGVADGWLWDHGTLYDLNSLVAPSPFFLGEAHYIDDRGEIVCRGSLTNGDVHIMLLVPSALAAREGLTSNVPAGSPHAAPRSDTHADLNSLLHASRFWSYHPRKG